MKNDSLPAVVKGDGASSPYGSLIPALEGLSLAGSVAGLGANIITKVYVTLTLDSLITNQVEASFDVYNPLDAPFVIEYAQADAKINGVVYATFAHSFDNFVVPAGQVVNSGVFGPVDLPQGAANSLDIINMPIDIFSAATARSVNFIAPDGSLLINVHQSRCRWISDSVLTSGSTWCAYRIYS